MKELDATPHKYQEICDNIISEIENGKLNPGRRLPGVRALGERFGCNYHTVRHAFEELAQRGVLERRRGSGTFVTERAMDLKKRRVSSSKVMQETDKVGVLLPLQNWGHYVTTLIGQLHHAAEEMGIHLNIRTVTEIDINSASLSSEFMDQGCCAVILPWIGEDQRPAGLHDFVRAGLLPVVIANPVYGLEDNCYWDPRASKADHQTDTFLQCNYFRRLGYKHIALLGPDGDESAYFQRKLMQYSRWCDGEERSNLIGIVDRSAADYRRIIKRWSPHLGDLAVIAYHDEIALEFMDVLMAEGYTVPGDVAVMGNNNNPNGLRSSPPLSTMLLPCEHIAKGLIGHALAMSRGESMQLKGHVSPSFVIRESCGGHSRLGKQGVDSVVAGLKGEKKKVCMA